MLGLSSDTKVEEDTDHEDLVLQRPQSSSVLIKKTIRLVRGYLGDLFIKTDRNNIFSAIFSTFREGPELVKDIEVLMPDLTDKDGWLIGFKSDSSIATLENQRLTINSSIYLLENAGKPRVRRDGDGYDERPVKSGQSTRKEQFFTHVTFRLSGIPYNTKGEELRGELNKLGFKLKSLSSLSHVLCDEAALKALKIKSGIVEIRQSCLKEEATNFQDLAGEHFICLDKTKYKIWLTRPGCCYKCNIFGHKANACTNTEIYRAKFLAKSECNWCHKLGHMKRSCPVYEIERECSFCHERGHIKVDCEALLNKIKRDKLRQERLLPFGTFIEKSIEETRVVSNLQNSNEKKIEELVIVDEATNTENSSLTFEVKNDRQELPSYNNASFPHLSLMSTPSKASEIPSRTEPTSTPIFDSAKLIKQYNLKANNPATTKKKEDFCSSLSTKLNPEQVITTTPKRVYDDTLSPNHENITQSIKMTNKRTNILLDDSSLLIDLDETVTDNNPSSNSSQIEGIQPEKYSSAQRVEPTVPPDPKSL